MIENYQHCIFVCSNYTSRTRTGLHFLYNDSNINEVMEIVQRYSSKKGVAFYFVNSNKPTINSVKKKDAFFRTINILEGTNRENIAVFDNAINNQITVFDVALLLLCRERMSVDSIKTALFYIYCEYSSKYGKYPFNDKLFFDVGEDIGFKSINQEFKKHNETDIIECTKPDVIMSKFFNCEGGVELMNDILHIFYEIKKVGIGELEEKIIKYFEKCKKTYHLGEENRRYQFVLRKKSIKKLGIKI